MATCIKKFICMYNLMPSAFDYTSSLATIKYHMVLFVSYPIILNCSVLSFIPLGFDTC